MCHRNHQSSLKSGIVDHKKQRDSILTAKQLETAPLTANKLVLLIPSGKIRCYVHPDVLRKDTPEEHVRQRVARSLVEEYEYEREDLHCEFPIKMGSGKRKRVDIAIFHAGTEHRQENIFIIVEAKQEDIRPTDRKEGVDQLKSYMSACVNAKWGLWVASEMQAFERTLDSKGNYDFPDATDIPLKGENEPKRLQFGSPGMRLVVREPIGQNPYWMSFSELMSNRNCITRYKSRRDPQRAYSFLNLCLPQKGYAVRLSDAITTCTSMETWQRKRRFLNF
ncbi:MAG: hypothetical protein GC158_10225 [Cyanobacteria bacterium RI_101]|nr:hypothetical protein [Cyanobacteria bacterium RI_101]